MTTPRSDLWEALSVLNAIRESTKRTVGKRLFVIEDSRAFHKAMLAAEEQLDIHRFLTDQQPQE